MRQNTAEYCRILQKTTEYYRILQKTTEHYRILHKAIAAPVVLTFIEKYISVMQKIKDMNIN